jgi:hypothetical protein
VSDGETLAIQARGVSKDYGGGLGLFDLDLDSPRRRALAGGSFLP